MEKVIEEVDKGGQGDGEADGKEEGKDRHEQRAQAEAGKQGKRGGDDRGQTHDEVGHRGYSTKGNGNRDEFWRRQGENSPWACFSASLIPTVQREMPGLPEFGTMLAILDFWG